MRQTCHCNLLILSAGKRPSSTNEVKSPQRCTLSLVFERNAGLLIQVCGKGRGAASSVGRKRIRVENQLAPILTAWRTKIATVDFIANVARSPLAVSILEMDPASPRAPCNLFVD